MHATAYHSGLDHLRPQASFLATETSTQRASYGPQASSSINTSGNLLPNSSKIAFNDEYVVPPPQVPKKLALAVVLPVYFTVIKPKNQRNTVTHASPSQTTGASASPTPSSSTSGNSNGPQTLPTTGGDGSTVTADDGRVSDPNDPFNNNAQPNSWTPPLNQSWTWGQDHIYGVNLGGLFVLEPFIVPALYQKYPGAVDEWTLSSLMAADTANGGINQLEDHYNTFITEADIAQIAGAGLNWIRLPVPFWAIETWPGEPFLAQRNQTYMRNRYIERLFGWCRKYGIRIKLDLHTMPGSQNGYNHSGKLGQIDFLNGVMGIANAQRGLEYIRVFTEFITQKQYKDVVPVFGIMNEAYLNTIGRDQLTSFYLQAHTIIRGITGFGEGNGPYIAIHDGFQPLDTWAGFLSGSDRVILDTHPYVAFDGGSATSPIDTGTGSDAGGTWPTTACNRWAANVNTSRSAFGVTVAGEFSSSFNDCGLFLRGVPGTAGVTYGGSCSDWQDSSNWSAGTKAGLLQFTMASMDALGDWFFWTWKIGNSTSGIVEAPLWSYQLGLENGWVPPDPRTALGTCASLGVSGPIFDGQFQSWQTGGVGAGTIAPSSTSNYPWPPATISNAGAAANLLPTYTPTGTIVSLPPPTLTASATVSVDPGNGWYNAQDTLGAPTPIAGCTYPDPWDAIDVAVPPTCS
ncbi:hypothetical protein H0H93_006963 [Arthromyces matolae]|nr:hypothetical protein H0H93_006963 [Arthromyces matolae]